MLNKNTTAQVWASDRGDGDATQLAPSRSPRSETSVVRMRMVQASVSAIMDALDHFLTLNKEGFPDERTVWKYAQSIVRLNKSLLPKKP